MSLSFLLKSFTEEDKPPNKDGPSLTGILQRHRLKLSKKKEYRQAPLTFSPYALGNGFCMREKVAQMAGLHKIFIKPPTPKEELMFDVGKRYHDILQRYFWKTGLLEGTWRCRGCWHEWYGTSPVICTNCDSKYNLEYREVPLRDEKHKISGRADGILNIEWENQKARHLVDIKSICNRSTQGIDHPNLLNFEDLGTKGPRESHVIQLMVYQLMSGIKDGHLLYVGKNSHQLRSFHIKYNEQLINPYLNDILQALSWASELKEGRRKDLPEVCSKPKCSCKSIGD